VSKSINVNPDHYKIAGRERPGDVRKGPKQKSHTADARAAARWQKAERLRAKPKK
jgi:hypothetical protein